MRHVLTCAEDQTPEAETDRNYTVGQCRGCIKYMEWFFAVPELWNRIMRELIHEMPDQVRNIALPTFNVTHNGHTILTMSLYFPPINMQL